MFITALNYLGRKTIDIVEWLVQETLQLCAVCGDFFFFLISTFRVFFTTRLNFNRLIDQLLRVGVDSSSIIFLTGFSTGLALALQTYIGFHRFGIEEFIGTVVALGMTRELGPVLTGLMVTGRCGSAMAAELGTMEITEQIDALKTLSINPFQYLIVPRIVASTIILPFLAIFSMALGTLGGYLLCVYSLDINPESYMSGIKEFVEFSDIKGGLIKSSFFGFILSSISTYNGYYTTGGARGVGISTTRSVVIGSITILIANYFLSSILFQTGIS
ncbi:MAG: ABC transporter permease [Candidatus Babeliaceae bacterium]|nr:ABC transporter permease [Candidatus Babeliaceae bacterium]